VALPDCDDGTNSEAAAILAADAFEEHDLGCDVALSDCDDGTDSERTALLGEERERDCDVAL